MQILLRIILVTLFIFTNNFFSYAQKNLTSFQETKERYSVLSVENKVYLIGGLSIPVGSQEISKRNKKVKLRPKAISSIEVYEPITNQLTNIRTLPVGLYDLAAVALDKKIYIIGGYKSQSMAVNTVYCFDLEKNNIVKVASLPKARAGLKAVALNERIYVFGGKSKLQDKDALVYDPKVNRWEKLPPMVTPREQMALNIIDDKILIAGGEGLKNLSLTTFEEYDPITNQWKQLCPLPNARVNAASFVLDGKFYLIGGYKFQEGKQVAIESVDSYDLKTNSWNTLTSLSVPQNIVGASVFDKKISLFTNKGKIFVFNVEQLGLENNKQFLAKTNSYNENSSSNLSKQDEQSLSIKPPTTITSPQSTKPIADPTPTKFPSKPPVQSSPLPTKVVNKAPIFYQIPTQSARVGQEICFVPQVVDPEDDLITLSCNLPSNIKYSIVGGEICLKPLSGSGTILGYLTARDGSGNQAKTTFYLQILENHHPTFAYISDLSGNYLTLYAGQRREINIEANDYDSNLDPDRDGKIILSLIKAPSFVSFRDYGYGKGKLILDLSLDWDEHDNQVIIEAADYGSPSLKSQLSFYVNIKYPNRPPVIPPIPNITIHGGETLRIPVVIQDPEGDSFRVEFDTGNYSLNRLFEYFNGQIFLKTPYDQEGSFRVNLIATDTSGSYQTVSFYVTIVINHQPTIELISDIELEENKEKQIRVRAKDIDQQRDTRNDGYLILELLEHPNFIDFRDEGYGQALIILRPRTGDSGGENVKKYKVTVVAKDNGTPSLKETISFYVTVAVPNNPPIIRGVPDQIIKIRGGEQYCVDFSVSDPDNDKLTVNVTSDYQQYIYASDSRVCIQPPQNFDGRITVFISAKDVRGKITQKSFVVRSFINHAPVFQEIFRDTTIEENQTLSLKVHVVDKDSEIDNNQDGRIDLVLAQAPRFVTFRSDGQNAGVLLIHPENGTAGTYTIELLATDNGVPKLSSSLRFQLIVVAQKVIEPPTISSVRFETQRLVITGSNFLEQCIVEINGHPISVNKQTDGKLVLIGRKKELNLVVGQNSIVVSCGNRRSVPFSYYFEKTNKDAQDD